MNLSADQRKSLMRGEGTFKELCSRCHGPDGKGAPMAGGSEGATLAPPLAGSPRVQGHREYVIKVLLNGLTGPVGGKSYPGGVMVPMGTNTDEWLADVASYVRSSFGNSGGMVAAERRCRRPESDRPENSVDTRRSDADSSGAAHQRRRNGR